MSGKSGARFTPAISASEIKGRLIAGAARGLTLAGEHVLGESNALVPIEEGTLERSGTVAVETKGMRAAISYDTPYAVVQHEDMTLRHDQGRRAKFLETAVNSNKTTAAEVIADAIRGEF